MVQTTEQQNIAVQAQPAERPERAKRVVRRRATKKQAEVLVVKSKRKTAIARAYMKPGKGKIRINSRDINSLEFESTKDLILEPVAISDLAKAQLAKVDIKVIVYGGGVSSQIQAVRSAIAKGLVQLSKSDALKNQYINYDRSFIIDDTRRVEPKKFRGPKARARFQTSYR